MNYEGMANEYLQKMLILFKMKLQKQIIASMQGETFALQFIASHKGDVLPGEISAAMQISCARITATLNSLEKKGLISRHIDKEDRRRIQVKLTQAGKKLAATQNHVIVENAAKMFEYLGEDDAREYVRITSRLADMASNYNDL